MFVIVVAPVLPPSNPGTDDFEDGDGYALAVLDLFRRIKDRLEVRKDKSNRRRMTVR